MTDRPWGLTFGALGVRGLTGELVLDSDGKPYRVAFYQGAIIGAYSPLVADAAVRVALTSTLITSTQVADITRRMAAAPDRDEVEMISELARLTPEQTMRLRRRLLAQRAARAASLERGTFTVEDQITLPYVEGTELDIRAVCYLATKTHFTEDRLADEMERLGTWYKLKPAAVEDLAQYGFGETERPILQMLLAGDDLAAVEEANPLLGARTVRAVAYALLSCAALEIKQSSRGLVRSRGPVVSARTTTPPPMGRSGAPTASPATRTPSGSVPITTYPPGGAIPGSRTPTGSVPVTTYPPGGAIPGARTPTGAPPMSGSRTSNSSAPPPSSPPASSTSGPSFPRASTGSGPTVSRTSTTSGTNVPRTSTSSGPTVSRTSTGSGPKLPRASTSSGPTVSRTSTGSGPSTSRTSTGSGPSTSRTSTGSGPSVSRTSTGSGPSISRTSTGNAGGPTISRTSTGNTGMPTISRTSTGNTGIPKMSRTSTDDHDTVLRLRPPSSSTPVETGVSASRAAPRRVKRDTASTREIEQLLSIKIPLLDGGADHYTLLGLPRTASVDDILQTYFLLARKLHPDRLSAIGVVDDARSAQRLMAAVNAAFAVLNDSTKRAEYLSVLERGGEAAVRAQEAEADELAMRVMRAEEAFRQGEMALRRDQLPQAVAAFQSAVELAPNESEYQALLAWSQFAAAADKNAVATNTRRALQKAADANPASPTARFYLGRVERMLGKEKEALAHFQEVLRIKSNHAEAASEVRVLEQRLKGKR